jgi:hypothetical protein
MAVPERPSVGPGAARSDAGLCPTCRHVRVVTSVRGSRFLRCALSARDPRYPKYPPQPVLACSGFAE